MGLVEGKDTIGSIIQYLTSCPGTENKTDSKNRSYNSFLIDVGVGFEPDWKIKKFAGKLKQIASLLTGIPIEKFEDQEFKKSILNNEWDIKLGRIDGIKRKKAMTVRDLLQKLGTEAIRDGLHPNAWVNALFADYLPTTGKHVSLEQHNLGEVVKEPEYPNWIITDVRFPNEAQAIKDRGGVILRVNRSVVLPDDLLSLEEYNKSLHPSETALNDWSFDYVIYNDSTLDKLIELVREMLKHYNII